MRPASPVIPDSLVGLLRYPLQPHPPSTISEGWTYSAEEQRIHGWKKHQAIDIDAPKGTPVFSPIAGMAFAGLQINPITCPDGKIRGMGGGYFVEIVQPDGLRVQMLHLDTINRDNIPFFPPVPIGDGRWYPFQSKEGVFILPEGKPIAACQLIGTLGTSGTADVGTIESPANVSVAPSWDTPHVHLWIGHRDPVTVQKVTHYDPFGLYCQNAEDYTKALQGRARDMWKRNEDGLMVYIPKW